MDGLDRSVWNQLTCKFIWGQGKDKMLLILKKEKAGALPAGRRWKASGGGE